MSNESRGSEERGENCAHELGFQRAAKPEDYPGADDKMMLRLVMVTILMMVIEKFRDPIIS